MIDASTRLLKLLFVLQGRRFWPGGELAERLEITSRTLRRDLERLRSLGYVVDSTSGPGGGYQLGKGSKLPPVLLDDEEAVALTVALRSAADAFATLGDTSLRLLAKLDQMLPARLRARVGALQAMTVSVSGRRPSLDPQLLTTLAVACRERMLLRMEYRDRSSRASVRVVEPVRLAHTEARRWYLLAWDRDRDAWRTFRVDRVGSATPTTEHFPLREPPEDVENYVSEAISHAPYQYRATALLAGSIEMLGPQVPPWCGVLEGVDDYSCRLETGADSIEGLTCQLVLCGAKILRVDPPEIHGRIRGVLDRMNTGTVCVPYRSAAQAQHGQAQPSPARPR